MKWNYFTPANHIDLRVELYNLLHGSESVYPIGQWVIYRRYDLNKKSEFYNEITREGVGGPKYEFTDELYLTYKWNSWTADPFSEQQSSAGLLTIPLVTFFFEHQLNPKEQDEVYEFDYDVSEKPILAKISKPYDTRYNIKNVLTYRCDNGRKEFYGVRGVKENIQY